MRTLTSDRARRIALTAAGLTRARPAPGTRRDVRHLRRVLDALDVVQLDSVNVLARAHELPFFSRLGPHDRVARDRWLWRSGDAYEGWVHVASVARVDVWPLLAHRRREAGERAAMLFADDPGYLEKVRDQVAEVGPVSVRDLDDPGRRTGPWWGSPKGKIALDWLARQGRLAVHDRTPGFMSRYDLPERVLPRRVLEAEVPPREHAVAELLRRAARAQGVGTASDLADHHRLPIREARAALTALVDAGDLERVQVRGWSEPAYLDPRARAARTTPARTLLSPFDPLVWNRERTLRLFDFHYRIEIYVPAENRVHGYYVLPLLLGDRLVGRVDLKADRAGGRLLVRSAFAEDGEDPAVVARELAAELHELAGWLGLGEVAVDDRGDLAGPLRGAV